MREYKKYSRYYVGGSAAPKIDYNQSVMPKPEIKTDTKPNYIALKTRLIILAFMMFVGTASVMLQHSYIALNQRSLNEVNKQIGEIEKEISNLKTEIAESMDAKYIERRAVEDLNMVRPKPHQIVYIDVDREGYTTQLR